MSSFPTLRLNRGDRLRVTLKNSLNEHTSIHWHGVRVPNAMDGVQYVTQKPVEPGEDFTYDFTPSRYRYLLLPSALQRDGPGRPTASWAC